MSDLTAEPIPFPPRARPRVKKLRALAVIVPMLLLAAVSTVFGMMMAVASDLPALEKQNLGKNSVILDDQGRQIGILTSAENRIFVPISQINLSVQHAVVAIEDKRFYTNSGVDVRGIGRAFFADLVSGHATQGASTIAQQFVKNALQAQAKRTVFQKLREAALAYHLTRRWSKQKILAQYLNTIYYGNGAYGIESAARTYFGGPNFHPGCGQSRTGESLKNPCAALLDPAEGALLAGVIASPSGYDPVAHPVGARARRDLVLRDMVSQGMLTHAEYDHYSTEPLPTKADIRPPQEQSAASPATPYFTTWVRQQVVDKFGPAKAFEGGLTIRSTLDLDLQKAAEQAVYSRFPPGSTGPTASVVVIDNHTGDVRAMVGGPNYNSTPFNLATQGQRQPGSSFKVFVLAQALKEGIGPDSVWPSRKRDFIVPNSGGKEHFVVNNFQNAYAGTSTLQRALTYSDNSVFAAVGIQAGTPKIARLATRMGIRTPVSSNYAIALGGLKQGVTTLDMAHAYQTIVHNGTRVTGTLGAPHNGPVGISEVLCCGDHPHVIQRNTPRYIRVLKPALATEQQQMMTQVLTAGTARNAAVGEWAAGKTGTTENYGDAWFVGFTRKYTVAVWVGYPTKVVSMRTDYHGGPVEGGTFPAEIWHDFIVAAENIDQQRVIQRALKDHKPPPVDTTQAVTPAAPVAPATTTTTPSGTATTPNGTTANPKPSTPTPAKPPAKPTPTPTPTLTPPTGGGGTGGAGGAAPKIGAGTG
ncbi:MAG TPA: transglycosylase domain-containing protein [Solirubrobacteraceae bacterium]